jgi:hypothetical protein
MGGSTCRPTRAHKDVTEGTRRLNPHRLGLPAVPFNRLYEEVPATAGGMAKVSQGTSSYNPLRLIDSISFPFAAFGVLVIVLVPSIGVGLQGGAIVGGTIGSVLGVIRYGIKGGLRRGADQGLKIGAASGAGLGAILGGILALRMAIDFGLSRLWTG